LRLADGDGSAEIVSCENVNKGDVHYTSTAVAQKLDGSVLWRWGEPDAGRKNWHHDVACQIHDWDGDGKNEVVLCTKGAVVELDGRTGKERRRIKIAEDATDCLVFCNLTGGESPTDILVKDRYHRIWAYDRAGKLLWSVTDPGGYRTAHQPRPIDLDGDGRDEIIAGYAMLNHDGAVRWVFKSKKVDQGRGHLDCARVYRRGATPEEFRIVLTCCGANNIAMIDGNGKALWEVAGHHFESIDVGRVHADGAGPQLLVDVVPCAETGDTDQLWTVDADGRWLGQLHVPYSRFHTLVDWNGDGLDELVVSHCRGLYDQAGQRIGTFSVPPQPDVYGGQPSGEGEIGNLVLSGNLTGVGRADVAITTPDAVYIFASPSAGEVPGHALGTSPNFTLY